MPYKRGYKKRARRNFRKAGKGGRRYYAKKYNNVGTLIADIPKPQEHENKFLNTD